MEGGLGFELSRLNASQTDKNLVYYALDMKKAAEVYDFYYHKEPWIQICKNMKYSQVFKGGIALTWGNNSLESNDLEDPDEQKALVQLLQRALDYRDMFGICPVKVIKDKRTGRKRAIVPEFGTGAFALAYDKKEHRSEVVFVTQSTFTSPFGYTNAEKKRHGGLDPTIRVYTWPGKEPSIHNRQFKSAMFTLFDEYFAVQELKLNALDADWNSSHPTIFTQMRQDVRGIEQYTEEEMFGDPTDPSMNPQEKNMYRRDVYRARRMEQLVKTSNTRLQTFPAESKAIDRESNNIVDLKRKRTWEDNIEPLPEGEEMAKQVIPQTRRDYLEWKSVYEDSVCSMLGVPRGYIAGRGKFKIDTQQELEVVRGTVSKDREDAESFYQSAYEFMYRDQDDKKIVHSLMRMNARKRDLKSNGNREFNADERLRQVKSTKNRLKHIGTMSFRIELRFNEDPFSRAVDLNNVQFAVEHGAITVEEELNVIRSTIDLGKLDKNDELVKLRQAERERKRKEADMQFEREKIQLRDAKSPIAREQQIRPQTDDQSKFRPKRSKMFK